MREESEKIRYREALEFIVANSISKGAWYVEAALTALGEDHPYNNDKYAISELVFKAKN
ncbi:hypothetical protein ACH6EH_07170 [Paenibacillus sp. JSM ZJ436]|uniref:hypothetical protein n=1 Tax=Paenibacillus sp. JSM ZJ436 TaxID=3376190 RepID=UPI0037B7A578